VLLHAAMLGNSTRFTRQDNIEQTWRRWQAGQYSCRRRNLN
jgi:glucose-6-phosphate 1-dehydrogenase